VHGIINLMLMLLRHVTSYFRVQIYVRHVFGSMSRYTESYVLPSSFPLFHSLTHIWGPLVNPPSNLSLFIVMHATLSEWAGNRTGPATLWKVGGVRACQDGWRTSHIWHTLFYFCVPRHHIYIVPVGSYTTHHNSLLPPSPPR
jgi:hypothetical protein